MKDAALRRALLIVGQSYAARRDYEGDLIANALQTLLGCAENMDAAMAVDAPKKRQRPAPQKELRMTTKVKLNGEDIIVYGDTITFADVQKMAGNNANTITYRWKGPGDLMREGILSPDSKPVEVDDGMVFNAVYIP